jgi:hypothetical protein
MLFQIVVDGGDAYSVVIARTSSDKEVHLEDNAPETGNGSVQHLVDRAHF